MIAYISKVWVPKRSRLIFMKLFHGDLIDWPVGVVYVVRISSEELKNLTHIVLITIIFKLLINGQD